MRELRNPFKLRLSEQIDSDAIFLRLFSPGVLDLLAEHQPWDRVLTIRSAPGGGKTSLLRLFTPSVLLTLYDSRSSPDYRELYSSLKNLGAINEEGPSILGVSLSCAKNYSSLEDLDLDGVYRRRLFYSLLNGRIILAALRGSLVLRKLNFPEGLTRIQIGRPDHFEIPEIVPVPCSGTELYKWAAQLEREVCGLVDSFAFSKSKSSLGEDTLYGRFILLPGSISVAGESTPAQSVLMLDDAQQLAPVQRQALQKELMNDRIPVGTWIAERLEALSPDQLLSSQGIIGREYENLLVLEDYWRKEGNSKRFEKLVSSIADRRIKLNPEIQFGTFSGNLEESLDAKDWQDSLVKVIENVRQDLRERFGSAQSYAHWIEMTEGTAGTPHERAVQWKMLEILIERDLGDAQRRLVETPLPEEVLISQQSSSVKQASEFFLSHEFKLPYYFGFPRIASLASSNIDQFLELCGDLFEEMISLELLKKSPALTPSRQENILRAIAKSRWDQMSNAPIFSDARRFLEAMRDVSIEETYRPSAPYAPGVTGVAMSMEDRDRVIDRRIQESRPSYARLARALSTCIANNWLEPALDVHQGGKTWMVLYLNRILCLQFGLPLQYGGWRGKGVEEMCSYVEKVHRPTKKNGNETS
ncbi:MAG: hypothetical protein ACLP9K_05425 [Nitrososphaerales archaeon]